MSPALAAFAGEDTPHCVVCSQLAQADERYLRRLQTDRQMRRTLTDALVASMGFCEHHWQNLQEADADMAIWSSRCVSDATVRLGELFTRTRLQDEFLQDLLFGARSRCPACLFSRRLEGRLLSRMVLDLEAKRTSLRSLFSTRICFEHARQLTSRAEGALRARLRPALRKMSEHILLKTWSTDIPGSDAGQTIERRLVNRIYPRAAAADAEHMCRTPEGESGGSSCPVCAAMEESQRHWLKAVEDNIRLGQPAWLTLPTCAEHAVMCLTTGHPEVAMAVAERYVDASLAPAARRRVVVPDRKRRRHSHRWFKAPVAGADTAVESLPEHQETVDDAAMPAHCPGCQQTDVAMRRAVFSFLHAFARTTDAQASLRVGQLCLKHLAEVMIYAPDERTQTRIVTSINSRGVETGQALAIPVGSVFNQSGQIGPQHPR